MDDPLFGSDDVVPSGLYLFKSIIDSHDLSIMNTCIEEQQWFDKSNQYMRFGAIPAFLDPFIDIVQGIDEFDRIPVFDQMISNRYQVGDGLHAHVDLKRFEDGILIASLKGTCTMDFEHGLGLSYSVFLGPGDVVLLTGSSRWDWTHAIPYQEYDIVDGIRIDRTERISITLRKMALDSTGVSHGTDST